MKLWVGALVLVAMIFVSGCSLTGKAAAPPTEQQLDTSSNFGRYDSIVNEQFKGWRQTLEIKNMAGWPDGQRKNFILNGVTDAAAWKFTRGNATVEIWARSFSSYDKFGAAEIHITSPVAWKNPASLAYGDVAMVGILHKPNLPDTLFLYASQNNTMFYINYFNDGANYNTADMSYDKKFLADIGRKLVGQAKKVGTGF